MNVINTIIMYIQFDAKSREWIVRCAQGDYQAVAKLAADNPKLVKFKVGLVYKLFYIYRIYYSSVILTEQ